MPKKTFGLIGAGSAMSVPPLLSKAMECYVVDAGGTHLQTMTLKLIETKVDGHSDFQYELTPWVPEDMPKLLARKVQETVTREGKEISQIVHYIALEAGTEFVGGNKSYPLVVADCKRLGLELDHYDVDADVDNITTHEHTSLPGISELVEETVSCCCHFSMFGSEKTPRRRDSKVTGHPIYNHILTLIESQKSLMMADRVNYSKPRVPTVSEFLDEFVTSPVMFLNTSPSDALVKERRTFIDNILLPQLMASYGVLRSKVKTYCVNDALNYFAIATAGWQKVRTGLASYHYLLKEESKKAGAHFVPPQKAEKVEVEMVDGKRLYKIRLADNSYVLDHQSGEIKLFDRLMLATNAEEMYKLLPDIDTTEMRELKDALKEVTYYSSELEFSLDQTFVGKNREKVYIQYDSERDIATLNRSRPDLYPTGAKIVVNCWLMKGQAHVPDPNLRLHKIPTFRHIDIDNNLRHAQQVVEKYQGLYGIYFGGIPAGFNDSLESAQEANYRACWKMSQDDKFTKEECYALEHSVMPQYQPTFIAAQLGVNPVEEGCCPAFGR